MVPNGYQEELVAQIVPMLLSALVRGLHTAKLINRFLADQKDGKHLEVFVVFQRIRCRFVLLDIRIADGKSVSWQWL